MNRNHLPDLLKKVPNPKLTYILCSCVKNDTSYSSSIVAKSMGRKFFGHPPFYEDVLVQWCPGGLHNMLRVRVCAAHMGGFLGPKFSKQGSFFGRFSLNMGELSRNWQKIVKNGLFSVKIRHKSGVGTVAGFGN